MLNHFPLCSVSVAGQKYADFKSDDPPLGAFYRLVAEPDNPHDPEAILIVHEDGRKVGHFPMRNMETIKRMVLRLLNGGYDIRVELFKQGEVTLAAKVLFPNGPNFQQPAQKDIPRT